MNLLTVDIGNNNPHVGIFEEGILSRVLHLKSSPLPLDEHYKSWPYIVSHVGPPLDYFAKGPMEPGKQLDFRGAPHRTKKSFLSMPLDYAPTLGEDRLLLAYYSFQQTQKYSPKAKEQLSLVIDAGTFTTIDWVHGEKGFLGGTISPGLKTLCGSFEAGHKLPPLNPEPLSYASFRAKTDQLSYHTTVDAMSFGLYQQLEGQIALLFQKCLQKEMMPQKIYLTGGELNFMEPIVRQYFGSPQVHIVSDPHLIHRALFAVGSSLS